MDLATYLNQCCKENNLGRQITDEEGDEILQNIQTFLLPDQEIFFSYENERGQFEFQLYEHDRSPEDLLMALKINKRIEDCHTYETPPAITEVCECSTLWNLEVEENTPFE